MKRLGTIGETRWWSKYSALRKVFGSYNNPSGALFMDIIKSLTAILSSDKIKAVAKARKKKGMDGEKSKDEPSETSDVVNKYRIEVYNRIVDTIVSSIEQRFDKSMTSSFYADLSLLHPRNFGEVPSGSMEELYRHLLRFDTNVTAEQLREELQSLGAQWQTLKKSVADAYTVQENSDSESENNCNTSQKSRVKNVLSVFTRCYSN